MSDAIPSSVRDQLLHFIAQRCRTHIIEISDEDFPRSLADLFANEPTRTTCFIIAMRTTPNISAPSQNVVTEREMVVANLFCFALEHFPPPVCMAELVSFAERHSGVGAAPEFRRLRNIVSVHAAAASNDSKLPAFGAGLDGDDAFNNDNSASFGSQQADQQQQQQDAAAAAGGSANRAMLLTSSSTLLAPLSHPGVASAGHMTAHSLDLAGRRRALAVTPLSPTDELRSSAAARNSELAGVWRYTLRPRIVKPYMEQQRARLPRDHLANELAILTGAADPVPTASSQHHAGDSNASKSAAAAISSSIATLVKLTLDSYVAKLPLNNPKTLREASESLLHVLLTMLVRGSNLAVKQRAFDVMLNLAVQTQLIDCSAELRTRAPTLFDTDAANIVGDSLPRRLIVAELEWVLGRLLEQLPLVTASPVMQVQMDASAARLLVAALKVVLMLVPPARFASCVPPCALSLFLQLPVTRQVTVAVFDSLSNAACAAVLGKGLDELLAAPSATENTNTNAAEEGDNKQQQQDSEEDNNFATLRCSHEAFEQLGSVQGVVENLIVAPTSRSAACLFSLLYCLHNLNQQQMLSSASSSSSQSVDLRPLRGALRLGLHWHCRYLLTSGEGLRSLSQIKRLIAQDVQRDAAVHRPLTAFLSDLITGTAAAHSNALCASELPFLSASPPSWNRQQKDGDNKKGGGGGASKEQEAAADDEQRFKLFPPDMPAICAELCNPRNLSSLLDDTDAVIADTTARLCAHAIFYEWSCSAVANILLSNAAAGGGAGSTATPGTPAPSLKQQQQQQQQHSSLPPPAVTSALLSVSRLPSARARSAILHVLRCLIVVMRSRISVSEHIAAATSALAENEGVAAAAAAASSTVASVSAAANIAAAINAAAAASSSINLGSSATVHALGKTDVNAAASVTSPHQAAPNTMTSDPAGATTTTTSAAVSSAQCAAFISRRFTVLIQQLLDVCCNAGRNASLPFVCGIARMLLESCTHQTQQQTSVADIVSLSPPPPAPSATAEIGGAPVVSVARCGPLPDDVVSLAFCQQRGRVFSATPVALESIGGVSTLWRLYKGLRVVDEHSATLLNQACCRLRLAVLRAIVSMVESHGFDVADVTNWRIALGDQCAQCSSVAASYIVRAVSEPFESEPFSGTPFQVAQRLLDVAVEEAEQRQQ